MLQAIECGLADARRCSIAPSEVAARANTDFVQSFNLAASNPGNEAQVVFGLPPVVAMMLVVAHCAMRYRVRQAVQIALYSPQETAADCAKVRATFSILKTS